MKLSLFAAGGLLLGGGGATYLVSGLNSPAEIPRPPDTNTSSTNTGKSPAAAPEIGRTGEMQPIFLSVEQVAALESGDEAAEQKVLNETIITQIHHGLVELSKDVDDMDAVDLSAIADNPSTQNYIRFIVNHFSPAADGSEGVTVCWTTNNVSGEEGFCLPGLQSVISNGTDGKQTELAAIKMTMDDDSGLNVANRHMFKSNSIHYVVDKTNDNRLYLTQ